jgi:beta-N-acetylhexosaminidase
MFCSFCADAILRSRGRSSVVTSLHSDHFEGESIHMLKRIGIICLWLLAALLIFICINLYEPYLVALRGQGKFVLLAVSFVTIGLMVIGGAWRRRRVGGRLLLLLWCLPPVAILWADMSFAAHKRATLKAEGGQAQNVGRHFVVGYSSFDDIAPLAAKGLIGGIYVTRRNISGRGVGALKAEIASLQSMRSAAGLPPLIVAADQEGGIVSHLSSSRFAALPSLSTLTGLPREKRLKIAEGFGQIHGHELAGLGVTLNFAPVVDLLREQPRNILDFHSQISRRAISDDPKIVTEVALAYVQGLEAAGIGATVKHFPGLGRVREDTHHFRASLDTPVAELEVSDWIPFRQTLTQSNAYLMVGHVAVTSIDPKRAASHSKRVINDLIRDKWGHQGIIITDDLVMGAVYKNGICKTAIEALNAGVDLLLIAYDGAQFYHTFNCVLAASLVGRIDRTAYEKSAIRLNRKAPDRLAGAGMPEADQSAID